VSRRAVTKAQIGRILDALEARGKTVAAVIPHPDGSCELRLTDGGGATVPSPEQADDAWQRAMGKWRHSA
jgi:hypothetical protein